MCIVLQNLYGFLSSMFVHNINPVLLEAFGLRIHYYGLFYAILFLSSYYLCRWYLKKKSFNPDLADHFLLIGVLAVIIGARLGHVFFYSWPYFSQNPIEIFYVWQGGLASHGATIALVLAVPLIRYLTKVSLLIISDIIVWCAAIGTILIRLANFINGEIVGRITDVDWGVIFPCNGLVRGQCGPEVRHPVQLYEGMIGVVVLIAFYFINKKYPKVRNGLYSSLFLIFYFGGRFLIEFFKEFDGTTLFAPLTNGQTLSIPAVIAGLIMLWWTQFKSDNKKIQK